MTASMFRATELDWLRSVRQARDDLIHVPALPVKPVTLPGDDGTYLCLGCGLAPETRDVFEDADGWLWCRPCAASPEVGAAFTQAELIKLSGKLNRATERLQGVACGLDGWRWMQPGHAEAAAEVRAIRDAVTLAPAGGPVPADVLFGEGQAAGGREMHAATVARWPQRFSEACRIVRADWPYECIAKDRHPEHDVYRCEPHGVWWHEPPTPAGRRAS